MNGNQNQRSYCCDWASQEQLFQLVKMICRGFAEGGLAGWCKLSREIIVEIIGSPGLSVIAPIYYNLLETLTENWQTELPLVCSEYTGLFTDCDCIHKKCAWSHCLPGNRLFVVCIQKILTGATQPPSPQHSAPCPINSNSSHWSWGPAGSITIIAGLQGKLE